MKLTRISAFALPAAAMAFLALSACGNDEDRVARNDYSTPSDTTTTSPSTTSPSTTTPSATAPVMPSNPDTAVPPSQNPNDPNNPTNTPASPPPPLPN